MIGRGGGKQELCPDAAMWSRQVWRPCFPTFGRPCRRHCKEVVLLISDPTLCTGAADGSLKVWDRRKLSSAAAESPQEALFSCKHHSAPIMRLEWSPTAQTCLATGSEDQVINVWDIARGGAATSTQSSKRTGANVPHELMFQHCGHHGMVGPPVVVHHVPASCSPCASNELMLQPCKQHRGVIWISASFLAVFLTFHSSGRKLQKPFMPDAHSGSRTCSSGSSTSGLHVQHTCSLGL